MAAGLWLWRQPHPDWREGFDWDPEVASFAVESRGAAVLLAPLAPPPEAREVWARLDALRPEAVVVLKPDHVRDVDLFVALVRGRAYGSYLFWRDDIPHTDLQPLRPGDELAGGLQAHYDGRGQMETPLYLPEQRALVFADAMTALGGGAASLGDPVARAAHPSSAASAAGVAVRGRPRGSRRARTRALGLRRGAQPQADELRRASAAGPGRRASAGGVARAKDLSGAPACRRGGRCGGACPG